MKIFLRLLIFLATTIFILLLPIYFLLWQKGIIVKTVLATQVVDVISQNELITLTTDTLNYLLGQNELPTIFPQAEADHMSDVADLIKQGFYTLVITTLLLIVMLVFFQVLGSPEVFYKLFRGGAVFAMIVLFIVALLVLIDFTVNFLYFHNLFFPQGNFIFPENSLLIQVFTERFFKEISIYIFMGAVLLAGIIITLSTYKLREK